MLLETKIYTNDEFYAFRDLPENQQKRFELINGVIVEMPSATPLHGLIAAQILFFFKLYLMSQNIGYAVGDNNDYELAPGLVLQPDAAYISKARLPKIPSRFTIAPDIAVEVVSPSNTQQEMLEKTMAYIRYGAQLVWVVYPDTQVVWVYRPELDGSLNLRQFTLNDTLDAPTILPGFTLPVADIFAGLEVE